MQIKWEKAEGKSEYYYGRTDSRFSAQIGQSTEKKKYVWMIFHSDFKFCVYGESSNTIEKAKIAVQKWLKENYTETEAH